MRSRKRASCFLDRLRLVGDLPVGPAEDPPALVHQAVLAEELVLVTRGPFGVGDVPGQAVDLEGHALVDGSQGVVDQSAIAEDMQDGELMCQ
jgi:hypothetical protein